MEYPKFDEDRFLKFLEEQAEVIKTQSFDKYQIRMLNKYFNQMLELWEKRAKGDIKEYNPAMEALFKFTLALEIASSNYRKENKGMWATILGYARSKVDAIDFNKIFSK